MKKYFVIVLFATILLTGCTKHENLSLTEYALKMKAIAETPSAYTLEVSQSQPGINFSYTGYSKGNKWRMDTKNKFGDATFVYNGKNVYAYNHNNMIAEEKKELSNPMFVLTNWFDTEHIKGEKKYFLNTKTSKNGFKCKLLFAQYEPNEYATFCVSDKYGIAVHSKMHTVIESEPVEVELNVKSIKLNDLPDNLFELPSNVKVLK